MENYGKMSIQQLKEIVERHNIKIVQPSGVNGRLLRIDYLASITIHLKIAHSTIPREWRLAWRLLRVGRRIHYCYLQIVAHPYGNI